MGLDFVKSQDSMWMLQNDVRSQKRFTPQFLSAIRNKNISFVPFKNLHSDQEVNELKPRPHDLLGVHYCPSLRVGSEVVSLICSHVQSLRSNLGGSVCSGRVYFCGVGSD